MHQAIPFRLKGLSALLALLSLVSCGGNDTPAPGPSSTTPTTPSAIRVVTPAEMNDEDLSTILFQARAGQTIALPSGRYVFKKPLKLNVNKITVEGQGNGSDPSKDTILSFKNASEGNGFEARFVKGITLRAFAVEDAVGDAILVADSTDVLMDRVRAEWTTDPVHTSRMAYGLYPVASDNVTIINSKAIGTRDAGIYVGQSKNITVSGNEVYYNVAGIEIENSQNAVVEKNNVHDNSGGILVFALPGTYRFKDNRDTVVRDNQVRSNNQPIADNATGFVRAVPPGTGIMVLASQNTEVSNNIISDHQTTALLAVSFQATGIHFDPKVYDPYLRGYQARGNIITNFGSKPGGAFADPEGLGQVVSGLFANLKSNLMPEKLAAVVWDGIVDPATGSTGSQGQGGNYSGNQKICAGGNTLDTPNLPGLLSYENLDLDLLALLQGLSAAPNFPFPERMNCTITLPPVTGKP